MLQTKTENQIFQIWYTGNVVKIDFLLIWMIFVWYLESS